MSSVRQTFAGGYTIVEVMVFLAVSGALFMATVIVFAGQNGRAQFTTAAREMESRTQDIINDASTGYYSKSNDFGCIRTGTGPGATPSITASATEQGKNQDCIFIGRVMHLNVGGLAPAGAFYNTYTVVGLREYEPLGGGRSEAQSFSETKPRSDTRLTTNDRLPGNMTITRIEYSNSAGPPFVATPIDGFGIFSSFGSRDPGSNTLSPGTLTINLVPLGNASPTSQAGMITFISLISNPPANNQNPRNGVKVCLVSGTSNQFAILSIGGYDRRLNTDLVIGNGPCPANLWI